MLSWSKEAYRSDYYKPSGRYCHATHVVGDNLYMWGGKQDDLPQVHDNEVKQRMTSVVEVFRLQTGKWEQQPTIGKPPLGVSAYASSVIGKRIFFFGGSCNHNDCCHNSLNSLDIDSLILTWRELFPTNSNMGPMMKSYCSMVSLKFDGEDYLLVVGGYGPSPKSPHHGCQYNDKGCVSGYVSTNEQHYYQLASDHWIVPDIIGEAPPPCSGFTFTSLPNNRVVLFGGNTPNGADDTFYICQCMKTAVHWEKLSEPLPKSISWPESRLSHAATIINDLYTLVVGGWSTYDSWLFNIDKKTWTKLTLPQSVTKRWDHSLSVWKASDTTVWVIQFGGRNSLTRGPLNDTIVIELICDNNQWSVGDIINLMSPADYQCKLQQRKREKSSTVQDISDLLDKKPRRRDLVALLADIDYKWEKIGTALDVPEKVLGGLRRSIVDDDTIKLIRVIGSWFDTMPTEVTWKTILTAIEGPIVKHCATGITIREFLAKQKCTNVKSRQDNSGN